MESIRIRMSRSAFPESWEMDCFVRSDDETGGELVHREPNCIIGFREKRETGLFPALTELLDGLAPSKRRTQSEDRMVIGRKQSGRELYYQFAAPNEYPSTSPQAKVWNLVHAVFSRRLDEALSGSQTANSEFFRRAES
jgi:hypothetical protein